jgi:alkylation response protein AidB-like acyl-CoA dehydrogenase
MAPAIAKRAEEIEEARRMPLDLVDGLAEAGCFRMFVPREYGGDELTLAEGFRVIEEVARADAATGWTVMIGSSAPPLFGFLPKATFDQLYAGGPDMIGAGTLAPKGRAVPVDGGYRVSGQWPFASGCQHSQWIAAQCVVVADGEPQRMPNGMPVMRVMLFPAAEVEILDTWRVAGLKGTGSHDIRFDEAFCPDERSFTVFGSKPTLAGGVFRVPIIAQLGLFVSAVAVGIAQAAMDDVVALALGGKTPAFSTKRVAVSPVFQDRLGQADATLRAARALLHSETEHAWAKAVAGEEFSLLERARMRSAPPQVAILATEVVDTAYSLAGGSSLYDTSPLQRRFRDIHALTQHAGVGRDFFAVTGGILAGEEVDAMRL